MSRRSARGIALAALQEWQRGRRFAEVVVQELLSSDELRPADRAFALELFYGVLRNLTLLDFWIGLLRNRNLDGASRDLLRLGLYQLLLLQTPAHAAVYEMVQLADAKRRSLINAILRAAHRERGDLLANAQAEPLSVRLSHPHFLIARWKKNFGGEAVAALCEWNNRPAAVYGRINRLRIQPQEFVRAYPASRPLSDKPDFVEFDRFPSDALNRGHCYIQDPSTAIACELLDPRGGETVLDACAAPGGKTALLAQQMANNGSIIACDRDPARLLKLTENLKRLGVENTTTVQYGWTRSEILPPIVTRTQFDRILLDVPCSNTGVMRRRVDVRWRLQPADFARMQNQQLAIARAVIPLLKNDGVLVYSTCSLEPEENDQMIVRVTEEFPKLKLTDQILVTPFRERVDGAFAAKFACIA